MLKLSFGQLCGLISWISNFFMGLFQFLARLFYWLIIGAIGKIADIIQLVFRKFAGLSDGMRLGNQFVDGDLVYFIFQHPIVKNLLISLVLLAVFILIIATFVGTIKTEFAKDGNNNKRKVIKNAFRGLANFVLVPVICMFGIFIGNALLRAIDGATAPAGGMSLSAQMFVVGGYNANRARSSQNEEWDGTNNPYKKGSFGAKLVGQEWEILNMFGGIPEITDEESDVQNPGMGVANFGVFLDDTNMNSLTAKRAADKIDAYFSNCGTIKITSEMTESQRTLKYSKMKNPSNWYGGQWTGDVMLTKTNSAGKSSTNGIKSSVTLSEGDSITFSIYNIGLVYYYYNLGFGGFDYLISAIALIFCAYTLLLAVLGLIKRIFLLATLFVISAPVCAIYPIDDGKSLERWRTEFIKEALAAYSTVVVMNIFLSLLPIINELTVFTGNGDLGVLGSLPFVRDFANYIARVLIVIGGLVFFKDASKTIAGIIGAGDATGAGAGAAGSFAAGVKRVAGGIALGAGAVMGAARLAGKGIGAADKGLHAAAQKKKQNNKDADAAAKSDAMAAAGGEGGKAESPGAAAGAAEQNSMNGAGAGGNAGGGAATGGGGTGDGSTSMRNASADEAATNAQKDADANEAAHKSIFSSTENLKARKEYEKHKGEHTGFYNKITAPGRALKAVHNSNIMRKFRNGVGGFFSAVGGIVSGKGKVGDAFKWTAGNAETQKKEKERKDKVDQMKSKAMEAQQHADELADTNSFNAQQHELDRQASAEQHALDREAMKENNFQQGMEAQKQIEHEKRSNAAKKGAKTRKRNKK